MKSFTLLLAAWLASPTVGELTPVDEEPTLVPINDVAAESPYRPGAGEPTYAVATPTSPAESTSPADEEWDASGWRSVDSKDTQAAEQEATFSTASYRNRPRVKTAQYTVEQQQSPAPADVAPSLTPTPESNTTPPDLAPGPVTNTPGATTPYPTPAPGATQSLPATPGPSYSVGGEPCPCGGATAAAPTTVLRPACPPAVPAGYTVGRNILGRPVLYKPGQPIRNVLRALSP